MRPIYEAPGEEQARAALAAVAASPFAQRYPDVVPLWERHWVGLAPALQYPKEIRRVLYTTNAIESLNSALRNPLKARGHFPIDEAAMKLLYLALRNIQPQWKSNPSKEWRAALPHLELLFGSRLPDPLSVPSRHVHRLSDRPEARADIFDHVECFYNPIRRRSTLGNMSQIAFERAPMGDIA